MESSPQTVELDVRPHLRKKLEPFQLIMDTVKTLGPDDTFILHATFKPVPLLGLMKTKGFAYKTEQLAQDHWKVTFVPKSRKHELQDGESDEESNQGPSIAPMKEDGDSPRTIELDNRGLEPPQPMVRTLKTLETCRKGDRVVIHNDRVPVFLIEELSTLGYPYTIEEQPDGSALVTIQKT
ncbi:DUF2249 domain-containing protein [Brevibacillus sp. SYP-B805]|uniref:DUF2249 domain-containing protein n=1 Tax=Brevibacillus sp. SYP-B805 TaxID=1578199 RepID=UPI0013EE2C77|nr:DUF2249 domain-containing protein [Brevibacillus sp. SYP-B805]NGQ93965.1 DUF2249 domain-containing protein [Brevibacillus sp. SYP-B805]